MGLLMYNIYNKYLWDTLSDLTD